MLWDREEGRDGGRIGSKRVGGRKGGEQKREIQRQLATDLAWFYQCVLLEAFYGTSTLSFYNYLPSYMKPTYDDALAFQFNHL